MPGQTAAQVSGRRKRFTPMQRAGRATPTLAEEEEIDRTVPEEDEVERILAEGEEESEDEGNGGKPLTRMGLPDRRFKGQRDLELPESSHSYVQPRQGGVHGGIHVTLDGKPDRRFKENRNLDEEQVMQMYAQNLAEQYGIKH